MDDEEDTEDDELNVYATYLDPSLNFNSERLRQLAPSPPLSSSPSLRSPALSKPMISMHRPLGSLSSKALIKAPKVKKFSCNFGMQPFSNVWNLVQMLRTVFSRNRRRIQREDFDLDLSYITSRIVAMSMPGISPVLALVRNPISEVQRYLNTYHFKHYKVYNLCVECPYDGESLFEGRFAYYPIEDHQPASLYLLYAFCSDVSDWLSEHPKNIIVVHCKAGKGRTGCTISALLTYLGITEQGEYEEFADPERALWRFATERTTNNEGVTRASQKNYVHEFSKIINDLKFGMFELSHPIRMDKVVISGLREEIRRAGVLIKIYFRSRNDAVSKKVVKQEFYPRFRPSYEQQLEQCELGYMWYITQDENSLVLDFRPLKQAPSLWEIDGDVKISVRRLGPMSKQLFYVWFPTMALQQQDNDHRAIGVEDLDKVYKYIRANPIQIKVDFQFQKLDLVAQGVYDPSEDHLHGMYPTESFAVEQESTVLFGDLKSEFQSNSGFESNLELSQTPSLEKVASLINEDNQGLNQIIEEDDGLWEAEIQFLEQTNKQKQGLVEQARGRSLRVFAPSRRLGFDRSLKSFMSERYLMGEKSPIFQKWQMEIEESEGVGRGNSEEKERLLQGSRSQRVDGSGRSIMCRSLSEENLAALCDRYLFTDLSDPKH